MQYPLSSLFMTMLAFAAGWGAREYIIPEFNSMDAIEQVCIDDGADCGVLITFTGHDVEMTHATYISVDERGTPKGSTVVGRSSGAGYCTVTTSHDSWERIVDFYDSEGWYEKVIKPLRREVYGK